MFTTDIYVNPHDQHATVAQVPAGAQNWPVRIYFANVLAPENIITSCTWSIHGTYKNNLGIVTSSMMDATTAAALINNNLALGHSCYLTCAMTCMIGGSSTVTVTYIKTVRIVCENL